MVGMSGAGGNYRCSNVNIVRRAPVHCVGRCNARWFYNRCYV